MPGQRGKRGAQELTTFAWEGMQIDVPVGWEMVSVHGARDQGYVGLADEDAIRLEMKWDTVRGKPDPADTASRYLQELRKKAKKSKTEFTVRRPSKLVSFKDAQTHCYEWSGQEQGVGMVLRCDQCSRMVHVITKAPPGELVRSAARRIFASLKDHSEGEDVLWSFYDVRLRTPRDMALKRKQLRPGCVRMWFQRKARELEFVRVSLAHALLDEKSLPGWFKGFYAEPLRRWAYRSAEASVKGHPGLRAEGRAKLWFDPGRLLRRGRQMRAACWHCESTDRLFIVRHTSRVGSADEFERAVESVKCCPEAEEAAAGDQEP